MDDPNIEETEPDEDRQLAPAYLLSFRCRCGEEWKITIEIPLDDWPPKDDGSTIGSRCECGAWREFRHGRFVVQEPPSFQEWRDDVLSK